MKSWIAAAIGVPIVTLAVLAARPPRAAAQNAETAKFVGSANCKKCHLKEYKSWAETPMAKAFETLKPGAKKEAKDKAKLDANKDYSKDAACLRCHTTGYGEPGGYPKPTDSDQALAIADRQGVGCETCHGPGSLYSPYMRDHEKDYKTDEAKKLGLQFSDGSNCTACHKGGADGSPTVPADFKFDGAAKLKAEAGSGVHAHFKKK